MNDICFLANGPPEPCRGSVQRAPDPLFGWELTLPPPPITFPLDAFSMSALSYQLAEFRHLFYFILQALSLQ